MLGEKEEAGSFNECRLSIYAATGFRDFCFFESETSLPG